MLSEEINREIMEEEELLSLYTGSIDNQVKITVENGLDRRKVASHRKR